MNSVPRLYPLFAQLQGRNVLVVGGGAVGERKVRALLASDARVAVGAPDLTSQLSIWEQEGRIAWQKGKFIEDWLDDVWLVIAATDDRSLNARIYEAATARRIWVNVVDDPLLSSFQVPAVVDRAPVSIAISSAGAAPVLARRIRERIEAMFDSSIGELAALLGSCRDDIVAAYPDLAMRRRFYDRLYDGPLHALLRQGQHDAAEAWLRRALDSRQRDAQTMVTLLATRSDDTGSLTLDGLRALNTADAIVCDGDSMPRMLDMARRDAERVALQACQRSSGRAAADMLLDLLESHCHVVILAGRTAVQQVMGEACVLLGRHGVVCERLDSGGRTGQRDVSPSP